MFQLIVLLSVFFCVAALVGGIAVLLKARVGNTQIESRLEAITRKGGTGAVSANVSVLTSPLDDIPNALEKFASRVLNLNRYVEQAGLEITAGQLVGVAGGLGVAAATVYFIAAPLKALTPVVFFFFAAMPLVWLWWKRRKRLKRFSSQLADSMDVMARALRSGYSLPAGMQLVGQQMAAPLGPEFLRCFEQQNLGIPLEQAIRDMTERVPNVDLRFFATAIILQRQTGGDLAEILDKIGSLIRERFKIWGQIQALTGEGRLSGIVLLALPPALLLVMLKLNYDYVMMLFNDPLGQKMLVGGIIMQIFGALVIKKIITIKV
jgi:tight adherence protein B